jgi:hypothetical protein
MNLGYSICSIEELKKIDNKNKDVIPIILTHLSQIADVNHKEYLVRWLRLWKSISLIPLWGGLGFFIFQNP